MNLQEWKAEQQRKRFFHVVDFFGNLSELATFLGVTYDAARRWRNAGAMPLKMAKKLEEKTHGEFTAAYLNPSAQDYFDRFKSPTKAGSNGQN